MNTYKRTETNYVKIKKYIQKAEGRTLVVALPVQQQ